MIVKQLSIKGLRKANEDYILSENFGEDYSLHIVADGMGGYDNGKFAAIEVANSICSFIKKNIANIAIEALINTSVELANNEINTLAKEQNIKMGATIGGVLIKNTTAYFFWVGDVKVLHVRSGKVYFESNEHSLLNQLKEKGTIPEEVELGKIRHIVTKSIQGEKDSYLPDIHKTDIQSNDRIIVCSDGILEQSSISTLSQLDITNNSSWAIFIEDNSNNRDNSSMIVLDF